LIVRTHFERKRVSYEKRPVGSVRDASMSPRASLTTKVLPSKILTLPSLTACSPWHASAAVAPAS
jgi:hypothetical protein